MSVDIEKLKKMTALVNKKIKKIHTSSYNSSLLGHPSELAEVRNVFILAGKTLTGQKIYFENMIEKAGFSSFHPPTLSRLRKIHPQRIIKETKTPKQTRKPSRTRISSKIRGQETRLVNGHVKNKNGNEIVLMRIEEWD